MASPSETARAAIMGIPFDPNKKPDRVMTVKAFEQMDAKVIGITAGAIIRDTLAGLRAVTNPPARQMAWVLGDSTAANNGVYENTGSPSAPTWTRRGDLPYSIIRMVNVGAGTPDAIVATSALPAPSAIGAALFSINAVAANTGNVTINTKPLRTNSGNEISPGGLTAGSIHAFLDLGDHYRLLSDQASAAIVAAAEAAQVAAEAAAASASGVTPVADRAALKALDTATKRAAVIHAEGERNGTFVFVPSNLSGPVAADPLEGVYVAPTSDPTGASGAWVRQMPTFGVFNVRWFGALGDYVADDTSAIRAALRFANYTFSGKRSTLFFPPGRYLYAGGDSTVEMRLLDGVVISGASRDSTCIYATSPDKVLFDCIGWFSGIENISFKANVTQTAGSRYVQLRGPGSYISNFVMDGDHVGVYMIGNVCRIRHGRFQSGAPGATRIDTGGGDNSQAIDDVLMGAQSPQVSFCGIRVRNSAALMITNTSVIQQGIGLLVDPTSSGVMAGNVFSLFVSNCFFDNSSGRGIQITTSGSASVIRAQFINVWSSSSGMDGVLLNNAGTGKIEGVTFIGCQFGLNSGAGLSTGGPVEDVAFVGGSLFANSTGLYLGGTPTRFRISSSLLGRGYGHGGNTNGTIVAANASNIRFIGNDFTGNSNVASVINSTNDVVFKDNVGLVTRKSGNSQVTNGTSSVDVVHGLFRAPIAADIKISPTSSLGSDGNLYVDATTITSAKFTVRLPGNASADRSFSWDASCLN